MPLPQISICDRTIYDLMRNHRKYVLWQCHGEYAAHYGSTWVPLDPQIYFRRNVWFTSVPSALTVLLDDLLLQMKDDLSDHLLSLKEVLKHQWEKKMWVHAAKSTLVTDNMVYTGCQLNSHNISSFKESCQ